MLNVLAPSADTAPSAVPVQSAPGLPPFPVASTTPRRRRHRQPSGWFGTTPPTRGRSPASGRPLFLGLASLFVGIRAVVLARKANQAAVKAAEEAELANREASEARAAVADERRRTFELEILRDFLEQFDQKSDLAYEIARTPAKLRIWFQNRLSLLPHVRTRWIPE